MDETRVKELIREQVDKYMVDIRETLFLQLIGFLEHEVWKRQHEGTEEKVVSDKELEDMSVQTGAGGEGESKKLE